MKFFLFYKIIYFITFWILLNLGFFFINSKHVFSRNCSQMIAKYYTILWQISIPCQNMNSKWLDKKWHHFALTYDGSNLRFYLDGVEAASGAQVAPLCDLGPVKLRIVESIASGVPIKRVDNVAVWSRALTPDEVKAHAAQR